MKSRYGELRRARPFLGTIVEIRVRSDREQDAKEAIDRAFAAISVVQRRMSFHDPDSALSRVNAEAFPKPVHVDRKTFRVLVIARDLHRVSNGIFDPTIAPYLEQTGFLPEFLGARRTTEKTTSFGDVELLSGNRVRFRHAGIRLDLGGIAKGFAVDEAVAVLRAAGVDSALVNAGGDLRAFGSSAFPVEIRNPCDPGGTFVSLLVKNRAVATSAHYFADRLKRGASIGPFVDPRLRKLRGDLLSATVAAPSAAIADALTKIVMLDPADCSTLLNRFAAAALVFDPNGSTFCTPNWHETLKAAA
jgi:thiamine biosynthesis lipoprotein